MTINGLYGTGLLRLTFINERAPEGYGNDADKIITIERLTDGTITLKQQEQIGIFEKAQNGIVYVNLTNSIKEAINSLKVRVFLGENKEYKFDNIGVKVYEVIDGALVGSGYTDENGLFEIEGIKSDGNSEVIYRIELENNIVVQSTILFSIVYDRDINIISASKIIEDSNIGVYYSLDEEETKYKNTANVDIGIKQEEIEGENKLTITKQDKSYGETKIHC